MLKKKSKLSSPFKSKKEKSEKRGLMKLWRGRSRANKDSEANKHKGKGDSNSRQSQEDDTYLTEEDRSERITLEEAKEFLPLSNGQDTRIRHVTKVPRKVTCKDVYVSVAVDLLSDKDRSDEHLKNLARDMRDDALSCLKEVFESKKKQARVALHVYVLVASDGDRLSRLKGYSAGDTKGCLGWLLCTPSGSKVYDGGVVSERANLGHGLYDLLSIYAGRNNLLHTITPKLCDRIETLISDQHPNLSYKEPATPLFCGNTTATAEEENSLASFEAVERGSKFCIF